MNADQLLAHYERIADTPEAIPRLRRFILDLAVRGKLVEQNLNDEHASELLKRIAAEKARLVKAGEMRKSKAPPELPQDELPFPLPPKWQWSRIAEIGAISPRNNVPDDLIASFVSMPMISAQYGIEHEHQSRPWARIKKGYTHFAEGDVGLAKITPCFENGKSTVFRNLTGGLGSGTTELHIVRPLLVISDYIIVFLKCPHFIQTGIDRMTGTAGQKRVPAEYFANAPLPLPPLAEQHRIVAKIDELMALCDQLEAARTERETTRNRLATASLARLNAPDPDPTTFQNHAAFALENLTPLTTRPDQIKALRQTILNLAVRGKLVEQDPNDEPAVDFDGARPTEIMPPFDIPKNWNWARLCALGAIVGGGTPSKARDDYWGGGILWVSPKDMKIDYISDTQMSISEAAIAGSAANIVPARGVLFVVRGMILAHSFPVAVTRVPVAINQDMKAVVLQNADMADYVLRMLKGMKPEMLRRVRRSSHGTCRIEGADYKDFLIPVPPLAEQHRIVAKLDEVMALCDRLEESLTISTETRRRLLNAALQDALEPDPETEAAA